MLFKLIEHFNEWLMAGMPLYLPLSTDINTTQQPTITAPRSQQTLTGVSPPKQFTLISNRNVYHPRKKETLLLRAGQLVSVNLLEKLYQFGIDVLTFCSLKEQHTGKLHPLTEETLHWLPNNQTAIKTAIKTIITKQSIKKATQRSNFLGLPLPPTTHPQTKNIPTNGRRFDATLNLLQACPLPNLLVLHPNPEYNKKLHRQLSIMGVEYQQTYPVLTDETLPYALKKYQPHVLIVDEEWLLTNTNNTDSTATLAQQLEVATEGLMVTLKTAQANQHNSSITTIIVLVSPSVTQRMAIAQSLSSLNQLATVKVIWKPYKRSQLQDALTEFIQTTQTQLYRRLEDPALVQYS